MKDKKQSSAYVAIGSSEYFVFYFDHATGKTESKKGKTTIFHPGIYLCHKDDLDSQMDSLRDYASTNRKYGEIEKLVISKGSRNQKHYMSFDVVKYKEIIIMKENRKHKIVESKTCYRFDFIHLGSPACLNVDDQSVERWIGNRVSFGGN